MEKALVLSSLVVAHIVLLLQVMTTECEQSLIKIVKVTTLRPYMHPAGIKLISVCHG
jgi:hypothetical protein